MRILRNPLTWMLAAWLATMALLLWRTVPVSGDGIYYYAWLRSVAVDGDVDFRNDLEGFRANPHVATQLDSGVTTPAGLTPNLFSVGPALLWWPVWQATHWLSGGDGFSRAELVAPSIATGLYGLAGLLLTYGFIRRALGSSSRAGRMAAGAVVLTLLGTNLFYYLSIEASLAHGLGFFAVALLVYLWWRWRGSLLDAVGGGWWRWLVLGLVAGLAVCVRWQLLGVVLVTPGIDVLAALVRRRSFPAVRNAGLTLLGGLVGLAPQLVGWQLLYGSWLTIPQGSGFLDWRSPHLWEVLVSNRHGLLAWTPLVLLATVGLVLAALRATRAQWVASLYALAVIVVQVYINGAAIEWWGGDAFGARRFVDVAALFALGLALLLFEARGRWLRWSIGVLCTLLVVANLALVQLYRLDRIPRAEGLTWQQLWQTGD